MGAESRKKSSYLRLVRVALMSDGYTPIRDGLTELGRRVLDEAREEIRRADQALDEADRMLPKLACPKCGHPYSTVKNSRGLSQDGVVRRRRECTACGSRYSTAERII